MSDPCSAAATRALSPARPILDAKSLRRLRALVELSKPRLAIMSVLTTAVAYEAASCRPTAQAGHVIGGTLLSAGCALALNEWRERDTDALMKRTRTRPLPTHELTPAVALSWSVLLGVAGVGWLALATNGIAAALSAATIVIYAFVYTPLKRRTRWATEIGAVSGALPPLIGSAAALGRIDAVGWLLFAILLCWQMPHFFAIGWIHRADYRAAGFPLRPAVDATGANTAKGCIGYTAALLVVSVVAFALHAASWVWLVATTAAGGGMLLHAWRFLTNAGDRDRSARRLFLATLAYMPVALLALLIERR